MGLDYILDRFLDKIKIIGFEKIDNIKILSDPNQKLTEETTLKNFVILICSLLRIMIKEICIFFLFIYCSKLLNSVNLKELSLKYFITSILYIKKTYAINDRNFIF